MSERVSKGYARNLQKLAGLMGTDPESAADIKRALINYKEWTLAQEAVLAEGRRISEFFSNEELLLLSYGVDSMIGVAELTRTVLATFNKIEWRLIPDFRGVERGRLATRFGFSLTVGEGSEYLTLKYLPPFEEGGRGKRHSSEAFPASFSAIRGDGQEEIEWLEAFPNVLVTYVGVLDESTILLIGHTTGQEEEEDIFFLIGLDGEIYVEEDFGQVKRKVQEDPKFMKLLSPYIDDRDFGRAVLVAFLRPLFDTTKKKPDPLDSIARRLILDKER